MKKQKLAIILFSLFLPIFNISAQVLENIPGQESVGSSDLIGYLNNLYKFGISITGILAVFMIALGAFSYIVTSAGNSSKMINAKEMINNALIGLVIVLTAYLFLYVINPDLVSGTLNMPKAIIDDTLENQKPGNDDDIGCCLWNYSANCNPGVTRAFCDGKGVAFFKVGDNLSCQTVVGSSSVYECVQGPINPPNPPILPTDMGCCVYPGETTFLNACNPSTDRLNCEGTLNGAFTVGDGLRCIPTAAGNTCQ